MNTDYIVKKHHNVPQNGFDQQVLADEALLVRKDIVSALYATGGGHYGGCLSVVDILVALYRCSLRVFPEQPEHPDRDRLILSKGHAAIALYAMLRRLGFFDWPLETYASFESALEGHPDMRSVPGVDFSTGSLGQGLSVGLGMALALASKAPQVWVILGDGECQEGQVWEAAMLASSCKLSNLHAVIDCNGHQEWGHAAISRDGTPVPPVAELAAKWNAFGWSVIECDGHDLGTLARTFTPPAAPQYSLPTVTLCHTIKGRGVPLIESDPRRFHCTSVTRDEHAVMIETLRLK